MKTRMILNKNRFSQIILLINILFNNNSNYHHLNQYQQQQEDISELEHPASILLDIENIIYSIKSEKNWFKSEFEVDLEQAVSVEWSPILNDNRYYLFIDLFNLFTN